MLFTVPALLLASLALAAPTAVKDQSSLGRRDTTAGNAAGCKTNQELNNGQCQKCLKHKGNSEARAKAGQPCTGQYARFAGYDYDSELYNNFYGTAANGWSKADLTTYVNGGEAISSGTRITEGQCEQVCLTTFPNPTNSVNGFAGFVYVPVLTGDNVGTSAFQCWCKSDQSSRSLLYRNQDRSSSMLGNCQDSDIQQFITDSIATNGGNPTCENVSYQDVTYDSNNVDSSCTVAGNKAGSCALTF